MSDRRLAVLLRGRVAGEVVRDRNNRLALRYVAEWLESAEAMPLSLSLPLAEAECSSSTIEAFIWGLLPDNEFVLERWAKKFRVSARNPFALIANVGEDCAGAVQFVRPDRLSALASDEWPVAWQTEEDVAERLRALRQEGTAWRLAEDTGQFSLAGAQAKTALLFLDGRWGVPSGRVPTTHILKPPSREFDGHAENEHFCLALAGALNLPVAKSEVRHFGNEVAIVVERYDRLSTPRGIVRIHQEDMCQALGVMPTSKYQSEGGPTPAEIVDLLRAHSSKPEEDVETFVYALLFNWLIAGTDAHAKNYALLHASRGRVRLAPLYDIASALPYDHLDERKLKLAMKVGGRYGLMEIGLRQWQRTERELGLGDGYVLRRARKLGHAMLVAVPETCDRLHAEGLRHPIVGSLRDALVSRAEKSIRSLGG